MHEPLAGVRCRYPCAWLLGALLWAPRPAAAQPFQVTFVLDLRQEIAAGRFDPARDRVGVRGGVPPLGWDHTLLAEDRQGTGMFRVSTTFPSAPFGGQAVAYKFKIERAGKPDEGWEEGRNRQLVLRDPVQEVSRRFDAPPEPVALSRTGTIRVHTAFPSRFVAPRDVQVYLPPGYDREPRRRYAVLYLHDGQNVFDAASAGMEWQVDETAERLIDGRKIEPVIVVAVSNSEARRDEYTPTSVEWRQPNGAVVRGGGKSALYGRYLVEELKPFIDRTYRTRPDAAHTAVGGASYGGLVSLWLALEYPRVFGNVLAVSPTVTWDHAVILRRIAALRRRPAARVWVDVGGLEDPEEVAATRRLREALLAKGWREGRDLAYLEQPGAQHDEISWASRVEGMLTFLYGRASR